MHYDDPEFEDLPIERGTQGLTYTLKGAEAFGSIYESGVDLYGCQIEDQAILENMSFVLVELEARLHRPGGGAMRRSSPTPASFPAWPSRTE